MAGKPTPPTSILQLRDELKAWLLRDAYSLWWERGADHSRGGFFERLSSNAEPLEGPRRSRVQPRQVYAFSLASALGWEGPSREAVLHGLDYFLSSYRRADGLFRTLIAADGSPLDNRAWLYDQSFALLGFAAAYTALDSRESLHDLAVDVRQRLIVRLKHPSKGFWSIDRSSFEPYRETHLLSNPHMHLFEACLEWHLAGGDPHWRALAQEIVELALSDLIDPQSGAIREYFDEGWKVAQGLPGRVLEPGHHFEWGWLLLRWAKLSEAQSPILSIQATRAALRLIDLAEQHGVDRRRGVVVNSLLDDFSVHDPRARLWPQTERLKVACLAATVAPTPDLALDFWRMAEESGDCIRRYLQTRIPGLWRDQMNADGSFIDEPAPASSLYHLVCAVAELEKA